MEEEKEEKSINWLLIILNIVIGAIILLAVNIIFMVDKVYALSTTYQLNAVYIGNDSQGTSVQAPIGTSFNYGPNLNYINGQFTGHNGSYNAHILVELNYGEAVNPNTNAQIAILAYQDGNLLQGSSGNCPKIGTGKYNCDLYISGSNDSNSNVITLQLKTYGTYYTNHIISVKVTGSITYDDSTANLNNGSFNQGISSINSNISGASSEIIGNQNQNTQDIINNQNANNQALQDNIDSQFNTCEEYNLTKNSFKIKKTNYYLNNTGQEVQANNWLITDYYKITEGKTYRVYQSTSGLNPSICYYGENKALISCEKWNNNTTINFTPSVDGYVRFSLNNNAQTISLNGEYCYNRLDGKPYIGITPDTTNQDDYISKEQDLLDLYNSDQLDIIDLTIDTNGNTWVWDRITQFLNTNQYIRLMFISILSLGIIKLVLAR